MAVINPEIEDALGGVAVSTWPAVAATDRIDEYAFRSASQGTGFAAAAGVTANGTLVLSYPAGTAYVGGVAYPYAAGTVTVTTNGPGNYDRRDTVIYRVGTGVLYVESNYPTYSPAGAIWNPNTSGGFPPVKNFSLFNEATDALMCEVTMPYNATSVSTTFSATAGYVVDKSNVLAVPPPLVAAASAIYLNLNVR